ncbi:MAG: cell division protein FtsZ [Burkholderiales bacterium]
MTDLTVALAIVGGVALAGVLAHGAWQARRAGPRRATPSAAGEAGEQLEPVLTDAGASAGTEDTSSEPTLPRSAPRRNVARLDALIDAIATLKPELALAGAFVLQHLPATRRVGSKPFIVEGLAASTGEWETINEDASYSALQAGVLLANRTGALNEIEYSEFVQRVQAIADALGAMPDLPDMLDVVGRARELDAFASAHDAQLALHLRANGVAWSVGYLLQQAQRHGFVNGPVPGRLVLPAADEGGPAVLVLSFGAQAAFADQPENATLRDVTLSFDVAQTEASHEPFAAWKSSANALAVDMDAQLVDDNGRPLGEEAFASIGAELERLYAALAERDLAAGSAAARRLFS